MNDGISASWTRLSAIIRKESRQMIRDPGTILMGIVLPMIMLFLFGYGVSLDVKDVPVAIVVENPSPEASELASGFSLSPYFKPVYVKTMAEAQKLMMNRKIDCIVNLRGDFSKNAVLGGGEAQIIVHGTDANQARLIQMYALGSVSMWNARRAESGLETAAGPVVIQSRLWYNDANDSHHFLVPGLIVVIMTIIGAFLTAMVVAREWENGTFEALFVTPVKPREILIGKTVPYFCLGMTGFAICVVAARLLFGIPLRGSIIVLAAGSAIYLLIALGIGLVVSAVTKNQFLSSMITIVVSFLPAVVLSGFIFDLRSMPAGIELITRIVPARYCMTFMKTVFLAGDILPVIATSCAIMAAMAAILLLVARAKTNKRLD
jgi:ABC-2 type transport system permease protein